MKYLKSLVVASLFFASFAYADGFGFGIGPFSLQFGTFDDNVYGNMQKSGWDSPICQAISHHNQLELTVEVAEIINEKEKKIVTKRLIVEPYAFAITQDRKPNLYGRVVEENLLREVTVKYGDERFNVPAKSKKGFFSGLFHSDKSKQIDIREVTELHVIERSHFDPPKNFKAVDDPDVRVICQIS